MEPRKPIWVARTVAHGVDPKRLLVPLAVLAALTLWVAPIGLLPLAFLGLLIAVGLIGMSLRRLGRLEWDGEKLYWYEWPKRRLVAVRGDGWVVRVAITPGGIGGMSKPMNMLVWCDHTGRARTQFMPERLWDPAQLERLRNAAWMPIADDASTSLKDVGKRYPGSVPWYIMNPFWIVLAALPPAILLIALFPPHVTPQ